MVAKIQSFDELFLVLLSDIYAFEKEILKSLPEIEKYVSSKDLKEALKDHLKETKEQVVRLNKIFKLLGREPVSLKWQGAVDSLFEKGKEFCRENTPSPVLDAAIIALAQRIEHFEIATYGTLVEYAKVLDQSEIKDILEDTIKEEGKADTMLTKLAEGGFFSEGINVKATKR